MQKILSLIILLLSFNACKKCDNVNLGTINLMPNSTTLFSGLTKKTLIFKDSSGIEIRFSNIKGLEKTFEKRSLTQICSGSFGFGGGFMTMDMALQKLFFASSINETLTLEIMVMDKNLTSKVQDTLLYDVLKVTMNGAQFTSISSSYELSKRGTNKPDLIGNDTYYETITLLGKPFKKVFQTKTILKNPTIEPQEVYYNATQGVVAIRLLNGKLFVLDRVE